MLCLLMTFSALTLSPQTPPASPEPRAVSFARADVLGGRSAVCIVSLTSKAAKGGVALSLESDSPALVALPERILIPAGRSSVPVVIRTKAVSAPKEVLIMLAGKPGIKATLLVRPPAVDSLALSADHVANGESLAGVITFDAPAKAETPVALSCSSPHVKLSASRIKVLRGERRAVFTLSATGVARRGEAQVSASAHGAERVASFTLSPSSEH